MNKDDVQALVRHGLTAGGGAGFVASSDDLVKLVSALATIFGILWSLWEKRQRPPGPTAGAVLGDAPTKLMLFLLLPLLALFPGCTTSSCGWSTGISPQRVESVTTLAAYGTATTLLLSSPNQRENLTAARDGFHALRVAERWDLTAMGSIAAANGLDQLSSDEGVVILTSAALFTDLFVGGTIDLSTSEYARAVIIGADTGLTMALGPQPRGLDDPTLSRLRADAVATRPKR